MSFSGEVKEELSRQIPNSHHVQIAELAGIVSNIGTVRVEKDGSVHLKVQTENLSAARKYFTLSKKTYNIDSIVCIRTSAHGNRVYTLEPLSQKETFRVLGGTGRIDSEGRPREGAVPEEILKDDQSRRAFIRGCFLACGSISNPEKFYHLEFAMRSESGAEQIRDVINRFGLEAKIIPRKKSFVVYLKEGDQMVDLLNIMEAHVALMNLENIRIRKEIANSVNRQVNCDNSNIRKLVSAASRQRDDILLIRDTIGLEDLPEGLAEIAQLRLDNPEASLQELGELLSSPVGKSGVNHRLRKIGEIAASLRADKEE